jgi:hypothetical protein
LFLSSFARLANVKKLNGSFENVYKLGYFYYQNTYYIFVSSVFWLLIQQFKLLGTIKFFVSIWI